MVTEAISGGQQAELAALRHERDYWRQVAADWEAKPLRNLVSTYLHRRGMGPHQDCDELGKQVAELIKAEGGCGCGGT